MCNQTNEIKIVTFGGIPRINDRPNLIIDNQKQKLLKENIANRKYINIKNWIYIDYKYKINLKLYNHNSPPILTKKHFSSYNFGYLSKIGFIKKI